jgi:hypothetical protein
MRLDIKKGLTLYGAVLEIKLANREKKPALIIFFRKRKKTS